MTTTTPSKSTWQSQARDPQSVELWERADHTWAALSSNGVDIYTVRPVGDGFQCQCLGYQKREDCCHVKAVAQRVDALARRCDWCGRGDAATFENGYDNGAVIRLCGECLMSGGAPASWWVALTPVEVK